MPTISSFYGIFIRMYQPDHLPPHFHAEYAEHNAMVDIRNLCIIEGSLPRSAKKLVLAWARMHQAELLENWSLCENKQSPNKIDPLD